MSEANAEQMPNPEQDPPEQDPKEKFREAANKLLEKEHFSLTPEAQETMREQIASDDRFVCVVGTRKEKDTEVDRFLKIPIRESEKIDEPFKRQILFGKFLKKNGQIKTRDIVAQNLNREEGLPYAIMETFKNGEAKVGFITNAEDMELLMAKEAQSCVATLERLHSIDAEAIPEDVKEVLQHFSGSAEEFFDAILSNLNGTVRALDADGREELYYQVLNRRLGVLDFREKVQQLLDIFREVIRKEEGGKEVLVHGDLSPTNLYVYDNGEVEFLDFEWSGTCNNEALAMIIDFGNLRARAWNNRDFREALDTAILEKYKKEGKEGVGKAVVALGILRSHMGLAGAFENYPLEKQRNEEEKRRRESTESDIMKAWEVAGLNF